MIRPPRPRPRPRPRPPAAPKPCGKAKNKTKAPAEMRGAIAGLVRELIAAELDGREFVNQHSTTKKIEDPIFNKTIASQTHEGKLKARFDAPLKRLSFTIPSLSAGIVDSSEACISIGLALFAPVKGSFGYKVVNVGKASTNFTADANIDAVAEIKLNVKNLTVSGEPKIFELTGSMSGLHMSNDIADWFKGSVQDTANGSIRDNVETYKDVIQQALLKASREGKFKVELKSWIASLTKP